VIADRTAYDVRYSCRPLSRIAVYGQDEYLLIYCFKVKPVFWLPLGFLVFRGKSWLNDTSYSESVWISTVSRKCPARNMTYEYNFQPPTCTDPEHHNTQRHVIDRLTDRRQYHAKSRSYCVKYDRLKIRQINCIYKPESESGADEYGRRPAADEAP